MDNLTFDNLTEPYSLESEQAVLGSILIDPQCLSDVMTVLKAEHFLYSAAPRYLFGYCNA